MVEKTQDYLNTRQMTQRMIEFPVLRTPRNNQDEQEQPTPPNPHEAKYADDAPRQASPLPVDALTTRFAELHCTSLHQKAAALMASAAHNVCEAERDLLKLIEMGCCTEAVGTATKLHLQLTNVINMADSVITRPRVETPPATVATPTLLRSPLAPTPRPTRQKKKSPDFYYSKNAADYMRPHRNYNFIMHLQQQDNEWSTEDSATICMSGEATILGTLKRAAVFHHPKCYRMKHRVENWRLSDNARPIRICDALAANLRPSAPESNCCVDVWPAAVYKKTAHQEPDRGNQSHDENMDDRGNQSHDENMDDRGNQSHDENMDDHGNQSHDETIARDHGNQEP
jgi:hypothetical protein